MSMMGTCLSETQREAIKNNEHERQRKKSNVKIELPWVWQRTASLNKKSTILTGVQKKRRTAMTIINLKTQ